jgi:DeoR family glycerol-3-phosphate regulon repressor
MGRVVRLHGGAGPLAPSAFPPLEERRRKNLEAKHAIGKLIAKRIPDKATLFIGPGSTMEIVSTYLTAKSGLTVMTINLHVAGIMQRCRDVTIFLPHGKIEIGPGSLSGDEVSASLAQYSMDYCLLTTGGIHADGDFYEMNPRLAPCLRTMMSHARRVLLAADSSKFAALGVKKVGSIRDLDTVITNAEPAPAYRELFEKTGAKLLCPRMESA